MKTLILNEVFYRVTIKKFKMGSFLLLINFFNTVNKLKKRKKILSSESKKKY